MHGYAMFAIEVSTIVPTVDLPMAVIVMMRSSTALLVCGITLVDLLN